MSLCSALLLLLVGASASSATNGRPALTPGRESSAVDRLAPEREAPPRAAVLQPPAEDAAHAPDTLAAACRRDDAILPQPAPEFHNALKAAGLRSSLIDSPGESHITEMTNLTKPTDALAPAMQHFLEGLQ